VLPAGDDDEDEDEEDVTANISRSSFLLAIVRCKWILFFFGDLQELRFCGPLLIESLSTWSTRLEFCPYVVAGSAVLEQDEGQELNLLDARNPMSGPVIFHSNFGGHCSGRKMRA
jgi:hypothetical protein